MSMHVDPSASSNTRAPAPMVKTPRGGSPSYLQTELILPADPLDHDSPDDPVVLLSHRQVTRLVFVAAEAGARFTRERSPYDPAAWMSAPRQLFDGLNALTACTDRRMFMRALVLHGVSPVYDMLPHEMERLLSADYELTEAVEMEAASSSELRPSRPLFPQLCQPALYTATFVDEAPLGISHVFFATVTDSESSVRDQLGTRLGGRAFHDASVVRGFDPSEPIALSLVSGAMTVLLRQIEDEPISQLSAGFSFFIEHRFEF